MRRTIVFVILCTILLNLGAIYFWSEYYRTLGHPERWDKVTWDEFDCFYNGCKGLNGGKDVP